MAQSLVEQNRRLRAQVAGLKEKLRQQQELHAEWVATMSAMHKASLESLERIRVEEASRRAHLETTFERVGGRR